MQSFTIDGLVVMPPLKAQYRLDPTIETVSNNITYEQGYGFEYHEYLKQVKDVRFNKSSSFTLTKESNVNDYFVLKDIPFEYPIYLTTYIAFNQIQVDTLSALTASETCITAASAISGITATSALSAAGDNDTTYLTILNDPRVNDDGDSYRSLSADKFNDIDYKTKLSLPQHYYFTIMIIDAVNCFIYHQDGDDRWYLSHKPDPGETLVFTKIPHVQGMESLIEQVEADGGEKIKFQYSLIDDENLMRIYKQYDGETHILRLLTDEERELQPQAVPLRLENMLVPDKDSDPDTQSPNLLELTDKTTFRIRPPYKKTVSRNLTPIHVNYKHTIDKNILQPDNGNSFECDVNTLVHSEYYFLTGENIPINFFGLKNQQTPDGITTQDNIDPRYSSIHYRSYDKLYTGTNQLAGSNNINLSYTANTYTIEIKPGMNYFNISQSLGAYDRVNINDTNLTKSGAIAGSKPTQSDKIYKKRANYTSTTRFGTPRDELLGTWLCTWLSGSNDPTQEPVWVDRFYNPSNKSYIGALEATTEFSHNNYKSSNLDIITNSSEEIFDIVSNMTIEPGVMYAYYRVNKSDIDNNMSGFEPHHIQSGLNVYKTTSNQPGVVTDNTYNFEKNYIGTANDFRSVQNTHQLCFNFDINLLNYKDSPGHMIFGNMTNNGFGLYNRNDVSPFIFVFGADGAPDINGQLQNSSIRIYDNTFKLYNYITNNSFLDDDDQPGLFEKIIIKELPDNIYTITSTGVIVEISHDGVILSTYTEWVDTYSSNTGEFEPTIQDICYDERYIYILTHIGTGKRDYKINIFDTVDKTFTEFNDYECLHKIQVPASLKTDNGKYGRKLSISTPPTFICISNDLKPHDKYRTLYIGYGDDVKLSTRYIWIYVKGGTNSVTQLQDKHDCLYIFDKKTLKVLPGLLTDNNITEGTTPLSIVDYQIDSENNIWLVHNENLISKYTPSRKLLLTKVLENRQVVSILITRDFDETQTVVDKLSILSKTSGDEILSLQVGPENHPTNNPEDINSWRKASPYYEAGERYTRERFVDENSIIYDDLSTFDDTTEIIYPFMDGTSRFGEQFIDRYDIDSSDTAGRVLDGDYELFSEGLDVIVTESTDVPIIYSVLDIKTGNLVSDTDITTFSVEDITNYPKMYNHYEYSILNFNRYSKNNLNFRLKLIPMFKRKSPDLIDIKIDLDKITSHPYTDYHNICVNINNPAGRVELWIDGTLSPNNIYEFTPNKYTFSDLLNRNITFGTTPYLKDTLLYEKLNAKNRYIIKDVQLKNFNMYTKCMDYYDIIINMRRDETIPPLKWNIPCKSRNYIETIEKVFNHSIPPRKSNIFDIIVRNSSIRSYNVQTYISNKIKQELTKLVPGGTRVRNITWSNELLDFTAPEADGVDYNPVAAEIIVDPSGITLPAYLPYILQ